MVTRKSSPRKGKNSNYHLGQILDSSNILTNILDITEEQKEFVRESFEDKPADNLWKLLQELTSNKLDYRISHYTVDGDSGDKIRLQGQYNLNIVKLLLVQHIARIKH